MGKEQILIYHRRFCESFSIPITLVGAYLYRVKSYPNLCAKVVHKIWKSWNDLLFRGVVPDPYICGIWDKLEVANS